MDSVLGQSHSLWNPKNKERHRFDTYTRTRGKVSLRKHDERSSNKVRVHDRLSFIQHQRHQQESEILSVQFNEQEMQANINKLSSSSQLEVIEAIEHICSLLENEKNAKPFEFLYQRDIVGIYTQLFSKPRSKLLTIVLISSMIKITSPVPTSSSSSSLAMAFACSRVLEFLVAELHSWDPSVAASALWALSRLLSHSSEAALLVQNTGADRYVLPALAAFCMRHADVLSRMDNSVLLLAYSEYGEGVTQNSVDVSVSELLVPYSPTAPPSSENTMPSSSLAAHGTVTIVHNSQFLLCPPDYLFIQAALFFCSEAIKQGLWNPTSEELQNSYSSSSSTGQSPYSVLVSMACECFSLFLHLPNVIMSSDSLTLLAHITLSHEGCRRLLQTDTLSQEHTAIANNTDKSANEQIGAQRLRLLSQFLNRLYQSIRQALLLQKSEGNEDSTTASSSSSSIQHTLPEFPAYNTAMFSQAIITIVQIVQAFPPTLHLFIQENLLTVLTNTLSLHRVELVDNLLSCILTILQSAPVSAVPFFDAGLFPVLYRLFCAGPDSTEFPSVRPDNLRSASAIQHAHTQMIQRTQTQTLYTEDFAYAQDSVSSSSSASDGSREEDITTNSISNNNNTDDSLRALSPDDVFEFFNSWHEWYQNSIDYSKEITDILLLRFSTHFSEAITNPESVSSFLFTAQLNAQETPSATKTTSLTASSSSSSPSSTDTPTVQNYSYPVSLSLWVRALPRLEFPSLVSLTPESFLLCAQCLTQLLISCHPQQRTLAAHTYLLVYAAAYLSVPNQDAALCLCMAWLSLVLLKEGQRQAPSTRKAVDERSRRRQEERAKMQQWWKNTREKSEQSPFSSLSSSSASSFPSSTNPSITTSPTFASYPPSPSSTSSISSSSAADLVPINMLLSSMQPISESSLPWPSSSSSHTHTKYTPPSPALFSSQSFLHDKELRVCGYNAALLDFERCGGCDAVSHLLQRCTDTLDKLRAHTLAYRHWRSLYRVLSMLEAQFVQPLQHAREATEEAAQEIHTVDEQSHMHTRGSLIASPMLQSASSDTLLNEITEQARLSALAQEDFADTPQIERKREIDLHSTAQDADEDNTAGAAEDSVSLHSPSASPVDSPRLTAAQNECTPPNPSTPAQLDPSDPLTRIPSYFPLELPTVTAVSSTPTRNNTNSAPATPQTPQFAASPAALTQSTHKLSSPEVLRIAQAVVHANTHAPSG